MLVILEKPLLDLIAQATELSEEARPASNYVLKILTAISAEEIQKIVEAQLLLQPVMESIGNRSDIDSSTVVNVFLRSILPAFREYSQIYGKAKDDYDQSNIPNSEVVVALNKNSELDKSFCLYDRIFTWKASKKLLIERNFDDDAFVSICIGHLVARNLAFPNVVKMLRSSRIQQWPQWETLWGYY
jgi:hypothetical protein